MIYIAGIYILVLILYILAVVPIFNISFDSNINKIGNNVELIGVCKDISKEGDKTSFVLVCKDKSKVLVRDYKYIDNYKLIPGRLVKIKGKLEMPTVNRNPKTFNYNLYLKTKGIGTTMKLEGITVGPISSVFESKISNFRFKLIENIVKVIGTQNGSVAIAMLIGDRTLLDDDLYEEIQKGGIAHVLAISGLHVGIIYRFITLIFRNKRNLLINLIILIFFLLYAAVANFSPSIVRAVIMIVLHILSKIIHTRYDLLSSLALSGIIILTINPWQLLNVGFQLSFLAIIIMGNTLSKFQNIEMNKFLRDDIIPLMVIQLAMAPFIAYLFNYFSFSSFLANLPCVFLAGLLIPIGVVAMGLLVFIGGIPVIFLQIIGGLAEIIIFINKLFYFDGAFVVDIVSPPLWAIVLFYLLLFYFLSETNYLIISRKNYTGFKRYITIFLIITGGTLFFSYDQFKNANVFFIDVGQGNSTLFRGETGKTLLIDGGGSVKYQVGKKTVKQYLLKNGVRRVDYAIATHLDTDHYEGLRELANLKMLKSFGFYEGNKVIEDKLLKELDMKSNQLFYLKAGMNINIDRNLKLQVLWPKPKADYFSDYNNIDENQRSLVMKVIIDGVSFLISGDIGFETEEQLKGNLKADVLQIPHHGSPTSTGEEFLNKVNPKVGIIQVGQNNYGHPAKRVIDILEKKDIMMYRCDTGGGVGLFCHRGNFRVKQVIEGIQ